MRSRILRTRVLRELVGRIYLRCKYNFLYSRDVQKARYVIKLRFYRSKLSVVMTLFFIFVCLPFTLSSIISIASIYYRNERKKKDRCNTRVGNTDAFIVLFASSMQVISNDCDITKKNIKIIAEDNKSLLISWRYNNMYLVWLLSSIGVPDIMIVKNFNKEFNL